MRRYADIDKWKQDLIAENLTLKAQVEALQAEANNQREEVEHWRIKAKCYGAMVHGITPTMAEVGFPVEENAEDGNVGAIPRAVKRMAEELVDLRDAVDPSGGRRGIRIDPSAVVTIEAGKIVAVERPEAEVPS